MYNIIFGVEGVMSVVQIKMLQTNYAASDKLLRCTIPVGNEMLIDGIGECKT